MARGTVGLTRWGHLEELPCPPQASLCSSAKPSVWDGGLAAQQSPLAKLSLLPEQCVVILEGFCLSSPPCEIIINSYSQFLFIKDLLSTREEEPEPPKWVVKIQARGSLDI